MDYMKTCKDNQFDLAIVDPPYGIGNWIQTGGKINTRNPKGVDWNDEIPKEIYFDEIERVSKNRIIWGANYYNCFTTGGAIVWYKGPTSGKISQCEIAAHTFYKKVDYFRYDWQSGFHRAKIENIIHDCQKPVVLYKWLLTNYAQPGDKLFDSHSGSGSFRIAAYDLGFDLISCELDSDYYRDNNARYKNHIKQGELFTPEEIQKHIYTDILLFKDT